MPFDRPFAKTLPTSLVLFLQPIKVDCTKYQIFYLFYCMLGFCCGVPYWDYEYETGKFYFALFSLMIKKMKYIFYIKLEFLTLCVLLKLFSCFF